MKGCPEGAGLGIAGWAGCLGDRLREDHSIVGTAESGIGNGSQASGCFTPEGLQRLAGG